MSKAVDPEFKNAGQQRGLEIWRVVEIVNSSGAATIDEKRAGQSSFTTFSIHIGYRVRGISQRQSTHIEYASAKQQYC
ncbi:hypothetical protein Tcan_14169 [Toxocara canis]|uniref:Uncharacterized protein n=1 Tax=Toxocara canis TaxID=6265 RepID=A0A0B2V052_TOXCA|nr:hypothetical protein Tcan_14169 [Toxocara canis]